MKKCTKCSIEKPKSDFYFKDKERVKLKYECKECNIKWRTERKKEKNDGYWYVYKIAADNYVGITSNFLSRKATHKSRGKRVDSMKKIARYRRPEYALIHEAFLHLIGYNGCALKPIQQPRGKNDYATKDIQEDDLKMEMK